MTSPIKGYPETGPSCPQGTNKKTQRAVEALASTARCVVQNGTELLNHRQNIVLRHDEVLLAVGGHFAAGVWEFSNMALDPVQFAITRKTGSHWQWHGP